jgi:hypothetical protein
VQRITDGGWTVGKFDGPIWRDEIDLQFGPRRSFFGKTAKLTVAQVREIRSSTETGVALSARYGVSDVTISLIRHGHRYRWVSDG